MKLTQLAENGAIPTTEEPTQPLIVLENDDEFDVTEGEAVLKQYEYRMNALDRGIKTYQDVLVDSFRDDKNTHVNQMKPVASPETVVQKFFYSHIRDSKPTAWYIWFDEKTPPELPRLQKLMGKARNSERMGKAWTATKNKHTKLKRKVLSHKLEQSRTAPKLVVDENKVPERIPTISTNYGGEWDIAADPSLPANASSGMIYTVKGAKTKRDGVTVWKFKKVQINDDGTTISLSEDGPVPLKNIYFGYSETNRYAGSPEHFPWASTAVRTQFVNISEMLGKHGFKLERIYGGTTSPYEFIATGANGYFIWRKQGVGESANNLMWINGKIQNTNAVMKKMSESERDELFKDMVDEGI